MSGLEMRYFILKPKGNDPYARASRAAMRAYADVIRAENPEMAIDLDEWADRETVVKADDFYDHDLGGPQV